MAYLYDPETGRYIESETGDLIPGNFVQGKAEQSIEDSRLTMEIIIDQYNNGLITIAELDEAGKLAIKDEIIRQYLLGIGGRDQMTQADWGSVGGTIADQYRYWNEMINALEAGEITPGELMSRSKMYIRSSTEAYWRAKGRVTSRLGYDEVNWRFGSTENHCPTCIERAAMGWQPACENGGFPPECSFPGEGDTECLTNCDCSLEYRKSDNGEKYNG